MITTRAKSKKAVSDICSKIFNKISTREALSVVEATKQNVLEAFSLPSNRDKLPLVAIEATSLSLAGFLPVKVLSKRHTWVSPSIASISTKSPKVFNNKPVNKLVFPSIASPSDAISTSSSKKMGKKTKSSEKWGQSLAFAIVTLNSFVVSNKILDEISIASFSTLSKMGQDQLLAVLLNVVSSSRLLLVLKTKQSPSVGSPVLENWTDQMETKSSLSLVSGATFGVLSATFKIKLAHVKASVLKNNVKLFCVEFASQVSLEAAFLVELTSSVHLATLKIAKSLMIFESGSPSTAVALRDVLLGVFAADIKTALSVFGSVACVVLKPVGVWQYVVVYFEKLDFAVFALSYWSVLVGKDSIRILSLVNQNKTIVSRNKFKAMLVNLPSECTAFKITDLNSAIVKTGTLRKCHIWWEIPGCQHCFKCQKMGHLAVDYKVSPPSPLKLPKSYAKTSAPLSPSEFLPLLPLVSSFVVLSVLVESIVKPIGSLVATFEQFINGNLVSSSALSLRINKVLVHMGFFSKTVGKLEKEVVSLKKECCMEDIDMSGDSELSPVVSNEVFSNLIFLWEHKSVVIKTDPFKTAE
ncbi:hypothetical protein G9A89_015959 [Geosiphon pyriformis]|nr:hypothetical protein G9A89_015959 [Geosiphon pyriformis]